MTYSPSPVFRSAPDTLPPWGGGKSGGSREGEGGV